jgi:hypothetical protein
LLKPSDYATSRPQAQDSFGWETRFILRSVF